MEEKQWQDVPLSQTIFEMGSFCVLIIMQKNRRKDYRKERKENETKVHKKK